MWIWILALSLLTSFIISVALGRIMSLSSTENDLEEITEDAAEFITAAIREFQSHGERCRVEGALRGGFHIVLAVHGQEVPVNLEELYKAWVADPTRLSSNVDQMLEEIEKVALEQPTDHLFASVATRVLPQIRNTQWIRDNSPAMGSGALVQRSLGAEVNVCYVIDDPWAMVFVCQAHLEQWGIDGNALHQLAVQNLRAISGDAVPMPQADEEGVLLQSGDGYDASRILLLDPDQVEGLLIAMPDRDQLWIGREQEQSLESLMQTSESQHAQAAHPVASGLFRLHGEQLEKVERD